jgi:hypothetical protein
MGGVLSNEMNDIRGTTQKRLADGSESSSKRQKQDSSVQNGSSDSSNSSGSDGSSSSGLSDPLYSLAKIITRDREMRIKRLNKRIYDTEYSLWMGVDDDDTETDTNTTTNTNSGPLMYRYVLQRATNDGTNVSQTTIVTDKSPDLELLFSYDASYVVFYTMHERSCECAACTSSVRSDFKSDSSDSGRSYNLVFNIYDTHTNRTETMCAYEKKRVWTTGL